MVLVDTKKVVLEEKVVQSGIRAYSKLPLPISKSKRGKKLSKGSSSNSIDRTPKLYIGGKQKRPDSGYSFSSYDAQNNFICDVPNANRKDVRDTVEVASKAVSKSSTNFNRAQILYYLAENLQDRKNTFSNLLSSLIGISQKMLKKNLINQLNDYFIMVLWLISLKALFIILLYEV